jgi:phage terminase large subunit GpA-like protein
MDLGHLYRYYNPCERCSKYKKLYLEEKQKYEDLKRWAERLIASNTELLDMMKEIKNK